MGKGQESKRGKEKKEMMTADYFFLCEISSHFLRVEK